MLVSFLSPTGMSLTKLSLARSNVIIPGQGEFSEWLPGWGRETRKLFFKVYVQLVIFERHVVNSWLGIRNVLVNGHIRAYVSSHFLVTVNFTFDYW